MERFLWICLGGAVGTGARYLLSGWLAGFWGPGLPIGTLAVNVVGSFLLGVIMQVALTTALISPGLRLFLTTGVMGGFTTYSTLNYETLRFFEENAWRLGAATSYVPSRPEDEEMVIKSSAKPTIQRATASYEAWLGEHVTLVPEDLAHKHDLLRSAPFPFLRGTYYRWAQLWPRVCSHLKGAREVLAVGDLHVENFGTWRDAEGRLAWGINDFDETWRLPYTHDLVRLATSAHLAIASGGLAVHPKKGDAAILDGYRQGLEAGGRPFVLAEHWAELRRLAVDRLADPRRFWQKLDGLETMPAERVAPGALKALAKVLPAGHAALRYAHRIAGVGSLGRQRFVALADWTGGRIAREAKAMAPSACVWASGAAGDTASRYSEVLAGAVRCPDPWLTARRRWIVRRLAPDCSRIELADLPREQDAEHLLRAMGWETANVHLGSAGAQALLRDLASRPLGWLHESALQMLAVVQADWESWQGAALPPPA